MNENPRMRVILPKRKSDYCERVKGRNFNKGVFICIDWIAKSVSVKNELAGGYAPYGDPAGSEWHIYLGSDTQLDEVQKLVEEVASVAEEIADSFYIYAPNLGKGEAQAAWRNEREALSAFRRMLDLTDPEFVRHF